MLELPDPADSVTDFPLPTGFPLVSFIVTVMVERFPPSPTTVSGLATTVDFAAEVAAAVGGDPSPGLSPELVPSPAEMLNGAENRWGKEKPFCDCGSAAKMPM